MHIITDGNDYSLKKLLGKQLIVTQCNASHSR